MRLLREAREGLFTTAIQLIFIASHIPLLAVPFSRCAGRAKNDNGSRPIFEMTQGQAHALCKMTANTSIGDKRRHFDGKTYMSAFQRDFAPAPIRASASAISAGRAESFRGAATYFLKVCGWPPIFISGLPPPLVSCRTLLSRHQIFLISKPSGT